MALQVFDGIVTVIPIVNNSKKRGLPNDGMLGEPALARISDMLIRSSTFLYPGKARDNLPRMAFLFQDNRQKICLNIRRLNYTPGLGDEAGDADLNLIENSLIDLEDGASHLIPVPGPACT